MGLEQKAEVSIGHLGFIPAKKKTKSCSHIPLQRLEREKKVPLEFQIVQDKISVIYSLV